MTKSIEYTVRFKASPQDVYNALMDSEKHTAFSGVPAIIENKEGGSFSCYGGALHGTTTSLVENEKIVQKWRAGSWEEGVFSDVTYDLKKDGKKTVVNFLQTGVPDDAYDEINKGWQMMYWDKLNSYFG